MMRHYVLRDTATLKELDWTCPSRTQALTQFGKKLAIELTLEGHEPTAPFMLDEWGSGSGPHLISPTIPVYRVH